jgi:hypothetical protein
MQIVWKSSRRLQGFGVKKSILTPYQRREEMDVMHNGKLDRTKILTQLTWRKHNLREVSSENVCIS